MHFSILVFFSFLCLIFSSPLLSFSNLQAVTITNGIGFSLLDNSEKTINFTLTSYSSLKEADWMKISYPDTKTYANVSIPLEEIVNCEINFQSQGSGNYDCQFKVNTYQIDKIVTFKVKSNDNDVNQFKKDLKNLCPPNILLNLIDVEME